ACAFRVLAEFHVYSLAQNGYERQCFCVHLSPSFLTVANLLRAPDGAGLSCLQCARQPPSFPGATHATASACPHACSHACPHALPERSWRCTGVVRNTRGPSYSQSGQCHRGRASVVASAGSGADGGVSW